MFEFGEFYICCEISKNIFIFSSSTDPDQRAPTGAL